MLIVQTDPYVMSLSIIPQIRSTTRFAGRCGSSWGRLRPRGFILHNFINPRLFAACLVGEEGRISLALLTLPTRTADVAL